MRRKAYRTREAAIVGERAEGSLEDEPRRVLVVDDSAPVRELIAVNLELEGYDVRQAGDGIEGLEQVAAFHPHVITLDVHMPRLDGFGMLQRLRADEATAGIPVVVVTGRTAPADRATGDRLGAEAFLTKPFEPTELVALVARFATPGG